jgi:hypothetical protein
MAIIKAEDVVLNDNWLQRFGLWMTVCALLFQLLSKYILCEIRKYKSGHAEYFRAIKYLKKRCHPTCKFLQWYV